MNDPAAIGHATGHRFSETSKALEVQIVMRQTTRLDGSVEVGFAHAMSAWCLVAPPAEPTRDALGKVTEACNYACLSVGDQNTAVASRDTRVSKYTQDGMAGEVILTSANGSRLTLFDNAKRTAKSVNLSAGGGFLSFDITNKKVGLTGMPALPGGPAPYLSIATTSIGLVSETGAASLTVHGGQMTASGSNASLDFGSILLGTGAYDQVVMNSLLAANFAILCAWASTHVHTPLTPGGAIYAPAPITSPPLVPLVLSPLNGSFRVKVA